MKRKTSANKRNASNALGDGFLINVDDSVEEGGDEWQRFNDVTGSQWQSTPCLTQPEIMPPLSFVGPAEIRLSERAFMADEHEIVLIYWIRQCRLEFF